MQLSTTARIGAAMAMQRLTSAGVWNVHEPSAPSDQRNPPGLAATFRTDQANSALRTIGAT